MKFIFILFALFQSISISVAQSNEEIITQIKFQSNYPLVAKQKQTAKSFYGTISFTKDSVRFFDRTIDKTIAIKDITNIRKVILKQTYAELYWSVIGSTCTGIPIGKAIGNEITFGAVPTIGAMVLSSLVIGAGVDLLLKKYRNYIEVQTSMEAFNVYTSNKTRKVLKVFKVKRGL